LSSNQKRDTFPSSILKRYPFLTTSATCRLAGSKIEVFGERVGVLFAIMDGAGREEEVGVRVVDVVEEEEEVVVVVVVVVRVVFVRVGGGRVGEFAEMNVLRVLTQ
jgi:hypothetical protein